MAYRLIINLTYASGGTANTVRTNLQTALSAHPAIAGTVGGTGSTVTLDAVAQTQADADAFQTTAIPQWSSQTRSAGFTSITLVGA